MIRRPLSATCGIGTRGDDERARQAFPAGAGRGRHGERAARFTVSLLLASCLAVPRTAAAIDAAAAEALMLDNGCNKCHAVAKKKDGPAYRDVAAKYRGKPDAEEKVTYHVTSGEMVKFDDGHEENHKKVKAKSPDDLKNLVNWILSLEGGKKY